MRMRYVIFHFRTVTDHLTFLPKVIFVRTRAPIDPVDLVVRICKDTQKTGMKRSRYVQRLTPVTLTTMATSDGLLKLADAVLNPVFHKGEGQTSYTVSILETYFINMISNIQWLQFAIRPVLRNHNILDRDEIIRTVAHTVSKADGHRVDLKQYDKIILVECFKVSILG